MNPAGIPPLSTFDPRSRQLLQDVFRRMKEYKPIVLHDGQYIVVFFMQASSVSRFFLIIGRNDGMKTNFAILADRLADDALAEFIDPGPDLLYYQYSDALPDSQYQKAFVHHIVRLAFGLRYFPDASLRTLRAQGDIIVEVDANPVLFRIFENLMTYLANRVLEEIVEALETAGYYPSQFSPISIIVPAQYPLSVSEIKAILSTIQLNFKIIIGGSIIPLRLWIDQYNYDPTKEHIPSSRIGTWRVNYETPKSKGVFFYFSGKRGRQKDLNSALYSSLELTAFTSFSPIDEVYQMLEATFINNITERTIWIGRHKITLFEPSAFMIEVEDVKDGRIQIPISSPGGRRSFLVKKLRLEHPEHGTNNLEFNRPVMVQIQSYLIRRTFEQYRRLVNQYAATQLLKNVSYASGSAGLPESTSATTSE